MSWFAVTASAYFLIALEMVLDKFLISSKRVSHPSVYAFYSGVLSTFAFVFVPFGFRLVEPEKIILSILAGMVFTYGILALFFAFDRGEASQVAPVSGAFTTIATYLISFLFLHEKLDGGHAIGVAVLIAGSLLISLNLFDSRSSRKFFRGFGMSILSGVLLAVAYTSFKGFYRHDKFINIFIWTRLGLFIGALSLFAVSGWRRKILASLSNFRSPKGGDVGSGGLFVANKALGGTGSILLNYAISLGSVTLVNALVALEYLFVFLMGAMLVRWFPKAFKEKSDWKIVTQKVGAIVMITIGVVLVSAGKRIH